MAFFSKLLTPSLRAVSALFCGPLMYGFIAILTAWVSVVASLNTEIKANLFNPWENYRPDEIVQLYLDHSWTEFLGLLDWNGTIVYFYFLFITLAVLVVARGYFQTRERRLDKKELHENISYVRSTIANVPPYTALVNYRDSYRDVWRTSQYALESLESNSDSNNFQIAIRTILNAYVTLAKDWDADLDRYSDQATYRCNFMVYRPKEFISFQEHVAIENNLKFSPYTKLTEAFFKSTGVLEVETELTTTTETREPTRDTSIKPMALLVARHGYPDINVPGAPAAINTGEAQWIKCDETMISEARNRPALSGQMAHIEDYYRQNPIARSFVSIPIKHPACPWETVGVINIYRNTPDMFREEVRMRDFHAIMSPFNYLIGELLWKMYTED